MLKMIYGLEAWQPLELEASMNTNHAVLYHNLFAGFKNIPPSPFQHPLSMSDASITDG
jgi:hypothetical protein